MRLGWQQAPLPAVTLPPLKLRKEVVQPETYKMAPRYVEQGASLRCGDPYQHGREQKQLDAAVASAHMRTLHPAPFRNSLAKPPRVAPVAPLFASMQFDEGSPLVPRSERMTDKARTISKSQWSSATHARALFDTSIV